MPPEENAPPPRPFRTTSHQATSIARAIDRLCRAPGRYTISLTIPLHRRLPWRVEIARTEPIQHFNAGRKIRPRPFKTETETE